MQAAPPGRISEVFAAAYNARDAKRLASLYTEDAELMPPDSHPVRGRAAIEALFRERFEQKCRMDVQSVASDVSGTQAFDKGAITIVTTDAAGASQKVS
jgi:uncharacterized protein (TIGR02246 family)